MVGGIRALKSKGLSVKAIQDYGTRYTKPVLAPRSF
jgi:hypothetical protein